MFKLASRLSVAFTVVLLAGAANAQTNPVSRIRGVIEKVEGPVVVIKSREGETLNVHLAENYTVASVVKAALTDVKSGSYVGIAALPQKDGSRKALEVLIFPEAMRGAGEGDRGWDLLPESTMTNATVSAAVAGNDGHTLTLTYKGGEQKITVPADAPIVTFGPATAADVGPGVPVFLAAEKLPDGTLKTTRLTVGKNGVAPPM